MRPINFEKLGEASEDQIAEAYAAALVKAQEAPKSDTGNASDAWARFSREAERIGQEIDRRRSKPPRDLIREGYEEVGESGGKLWELHRGCRWDHVITDVVIAPNGKSLFIKTAQVRG